MDTMSLAGLLLTACAAFAYLNHRFLRLPTTVGVMLIALALSLVLVLAGRLGLGGVAQYARGVLAQVDFGATLMEGMLSFLLFAGALHVNLEDLARQKWVVLTLATLGTLTATFLIGGLMWLALGALGLDLPFLYCLLFGALISPTDPVAVLGILKSAGAPRSLETKIAGESLFNDGFALVTFLVLLALATGERSLDAGEVGLLFLQEAAGGLLLGGACGWLAYLALRSIDNYQVEVLITLALVTGGYALANALHTSGPLAMVVAGLLIGNRGRLLAMSERTREHLDTFWELLDEVLNAVLFVLMGLEAMVLSFSGQSLLAALLAVPIVLLARFVSVGIPVALFRLRREFTPHAVTLLTWGGLRGGISVALALSLPPGSVRDTLVGITYVVVAFSVLVQGLTVGRLVRLTQAS